jgi:hypothetical protein
MWENIIETDLTEKDEDGVIWTGLIWLSIGTS